MPSIHSGGIQYIFQAILCFSFGSISLDSQYDTLYCAPLRTEHNTQHNGHNKYVLFVLNKSQWRTRINECMLQSCRCCCSITQTNKHRCIYAIRFACRLRNKKKWQLSRNFTQNTNFIFILRLRYGRNRFIWAVHSIYYKRTCLKWRPDSRRSFSFSIHNNWMRICFSIILVKFGGQRTLVISMEWKRLRWNQLYVCRFIA